MLRDTASEDERMDNKQDNSPITFVVPGQSVVGGLGSFGGSITRGAAGTEWDSLPGHPKAAVRVAATRSAAPLQRVQAVPGEDIVALHIAGGPVLLLHPANARDLLLGQSGVPVSRGAESGDVPVGAQLRWRGLESGGATTRGWLGDVVLSRFQVLTGLLKDPAATLVASEVVKRVDAQVDPGVYKLRADKLPRLKGSGTGVTQIPFSPEPVLVLVHGTFVETTSTFGKLWAHHPSRVADLFRHYGGRVYALEHETLGKSPAANAMLLAQALAPGQIVHLVTHSRGGLVGEVLARLAHQKAFDIADAKHFPGSDHEQQREELMSLAALLAAKQIEVQRMVRVACPARGTLLAARRLDAYVSVLKWTLDGFGVPVLPELVDFLGEVARRRADPGQIPGLAAMIPETPLVNWLNAAPEPIAGELRVVSGDLEGDSLGSWLKTLLADAYYWTDNDIVVHTRSMYAGAPRVGGASFLLDQSGKTTHFAYFSNPRTVDAVVDGLIENTPPSGFMKIGPLSWLGQDSSGWRSSDVAAATLHDADRPAVFVLPGILGSHLKRDGKRVWLSLRIVGGLQGLLADAASRNADVKPDGAIGMVYDRLMAHLSSSHDVHEFAFDWRLPIEEEAERLAQEVTAALDARQFSGMPVRLLAHSMGGLVARTMQICEPEVWQRLMAHDGARLVMLGTPNAGSWAPMQVLSGDDTFGNVLTAFGSPLADQRARQLMAELPGFMQLQAALVDPELALDQQATWAKLAQDDYRRSQANNWWHRHAGEAMDAAYRWGVPTQRVLDLACALRRNLDLQASRDLPGFAHKLALVVGHAGATPIGYSAAPGEDFVYRDSADGDGRVPLASALLPGVKTWVANAEHGSLPSSPGIFAGIVELLVTGNTDKLTPFSPARSRAAAGAETAVRKSRPARVRRQARPASSEAGVFAVVEPLADATAPATAQALRVRVLNGNLAFVAEPLIVGHYSSRELTGTEAVLNRLLGGSMADALAVGLYPQTIGSQRVFVNTALDRENPWRVPRPHGTVVAGLGDEGALRESDLVTVVTQATLAWASRLNEDGASRRATSDTDAPGAVIPLAATLLGSGGLGVSAASAARALARGVYQANQRLAQIGWPQVGTLTLVELYLERAADAWQGLQVLAAASPEMLRVAPQIDFGTGPLRRTLGSGYRGTDYDLVTATSIGRELTAAGGTSNQPADIEFALDSHRARTELRSQRVQAKLIRILVEKAAGSRADDSSIGRTLFQLLVPPEIEPFLGGIDRMVIDLDAHTAGIPWELLDAGNAGSGGDVRPWAVRCKLLRRLRKTTFRATPRYASADDAVLVIGEPLLEADSGYPPLPAAREEALVIAAELDGHGGVSAERLTTLAEQPDASTVIERLMARAWRVVHIAGHGESVTDGGRGVVLSGGLFLGPSEIRSMRTVPELVFINCCHVGAWGHDRVLGHDDPAAYAASVADALIETGVRCVIVTGWAVEDQPAFEFARVLYRALLRGERFVDAVAAAREACWQVAPAGKTWAAYQCYGDPNWKWRTRVGDAQAASERHDEYASIASPVGLALALETLATETGYMDKPAAEQRMRIDELEQRFGAAWGSIGAVAEAFGVALEAVGARTEAIVWLERAIGANDSSASMKAAEALHNLRARRAWSDSKPGEVLDPTRDAEIEKSLDGLRSMCALQPTVERLSLLGSAYKRRAMLERRRSGDPKAERAMRRALVQSLNAYRQAEELARAQQSPELFYPGLNRMALELMLRGARRKSGTGRETLEPRRDDYELRASIEHRTRTAPDFWSMVGRVEFELYRALAEARLAGAAPMLEQAWTDVHMRVPTPSWWQSVFDQASLVLADWFATPDMAEQRAARRLWKLLQGFARQPTAPAGSRSASDTDIGIAAEKSDEDADSLRPGARGAPPPRIVIWHAAADRRLADPLVEMARKLDPGAWAAGRKSTMPQLESALSQASLCVVVAGPGLVRDKEAWRHLATIQRALAAPNGPQLLGLRTPGVEAPVQFAENQFEQLGHGAEGLHKAWLVATAAASAVAIPTGAVVPTAGSGVGGETS
jgi:CHAT domain/Lecithin:cholesterol acyltransferase